MKHSKRERMNSLETKRKPNLLIIISIIIFLLLLSSNIITVFLLMQTKDSLSDQSLLLAETKGSFEIADRDSKELEEVKSKYESLQKENAVKIEEINSLTSDIATLNERISQTQSDFVPENPEPIHIDQPQNIKPKAQDDSPTSFSEGSSKDHVKKLMGSPDSVILNSWWYGKQSWIKFDENDLVSSWYDGEGILKTK